MPRDVDNDADLDAWYDARQDADDARTDQARDVLPMPINPRWA